MGVHESQSLLWERMVALSPAFAEYLLPKLRAQFPDQIPGSTSGSDLYGALNVVKAPSLIRVESDELSYSMHVILRCATNPNANLKQPKTTQNNPKALKPIMKTLEP